MIILKKICHHYSSTRISVQDMLIFAAIVQFIMNPITIWSSMTLLVFLIANFVISLIGMDFDRNQVFYEEQEQCEVKIVFPETPNPVSDLQGIPEADLRRAKDGLSR
jgi:hypothetical protein